MKVSEKRKDAAYLAIHDTLMDLRIALNRDSLPAKHDAQIAQVETVIWRKLQAALNIE